METQHQGYAVEPAWRAVIKDLGMSPGAVLRRAGLPEDLLSRSRARVSTEEFFRFWGALEAESQDPLLPLRLVQVMSAESFQPPVFAALCSPDLATALGRISHYKPLVAPCRLEVEQSSTELRLRIAWLEAALPVPPGLVAAELAFFVHLSRTATREAVVPLAVSTPEPAAPAGAYEAFFGVPVRRGEFHEVRFSAVDARRPFLTHNEAMWEMFEPQLRQRLADLERDASVAQRVHAVLLEALPSGQASMDEVAGRLAMSRRTLQRRLREEETSFQEMLRQTREALARHYLTRTALATAEISFLLGFEEPNSFYRAFSGWTGSTPESVRRAAAA